MQPEETDKARKQEARIQTKQRTKEKKNEIKDRRENVN